MERAKAEQLRDIFNKYSTGEEENGDKYMTYNDFIQSYIGLCQPTPPTTKEGDISEETAAQKTARLKSGITANQQLTIEKLAAIVDTSQDGKITFHDFKAFESLLKKPDVLYRVAFRLFDSNQDGSVSFPETRKFYESTVKHQKTEFNWDCELINDTFGKNKTNALSFMEFSLFLNRVNYEHAKQRFNSESKNNASLNAQQFRKLMLEMRPQRLTEFLRENLTEFVTVDGGHTLKYPTFAAFNSLLDNIEMCRRVFDKMCVNSGYYNDTQASTHFEVTHEQFLQEAVRLSNLTPMEVQVLFKIVKLLRNEESAVDAPILPEAKLRKNDFLKIAPFEEGMLPQNISTVNQADEASTSRSTSTALWEGLYRLGLGTLAGMAGCFFVYPIDLVKTRMQNQRTSGSYAGQQLYSGPVACIKHVYRYEGIRGCYRGIMAQLIGVGPEKALKLMVNDTVRDILRKDGQVSPAGQLLAGAAAGGAQVMITNPLEIVKIRLQTASETGGTTSALKIIRELGFGGIYKGASACFLRDIPFSLIYFPTYSYLKTKLLNFSSCVSKDGTLNDLGWLMAGMAAGAPAAFLTTPADVIKTRLQVRAKTDGSPNYKGLFDCGKSIFREEGASAFFKGGPLRVMRSSPQFGITLLTYEKLQQWGRPYSQRWFHGSQPIGSQAQVRSIHISKLPPLNSDHIGGYRVAAATYAGVDNKFSLQWPK